MAREGHTLLDAPDFALPPLSSQTVSRIRTDYAFDIQLVIDNQSAASPERLA